jgi:phosphoglycolate phosphatase
MKYRWVIFDFDGTLADSFPFFALTFNELADAHGFRRVEAGEAAALRELDVREIMRRVGLPPWKLPRVARDFTARMQANADEVRPFPGIEAALEHLSTRGIALAIVSSNAQPTITRVLGPASSARIGAFECGMSLFGKATRLRSVVKRAGVSPRQALYIGDQTTDLDAARDAGMASGAVGWGYATMASLRARNPEETFETVQELHRLAEP